MAYFFNDRIFLIQDLFRIFFFQNHFGPLKKYEPLPWGRAAPPDPPLLFGSGRRACELIPRWVGIGAILPEGRADPLDTPCFSGKGCCQCAPASNDASEDEVGGKIKK